MPLSPNSLEAISGSDNLLQLCQRLQRDLLLIMLVNMADQPAHPGILTLAGRGLGIGGNTARQLFHPECQKIADLPHTGQLIAGLFLKIVQCRSESQIMDPLPICWCKMIQHFGGKSNIGKFGVIILAEAVGYLDAQRT